MIYFISYCEGNEPVTIETTNLCGILKELFQNALDGFDISHVRITKP